MGVAAWSPDHGHPIGAKHAISGDDRELVQERLCHQQAVERIAVMERQICDSGRVSEF